MRNNVANINSFLTSKKLLDKDRASGSLSHDSSLRSLGKSTIISKKVVDQQEDSNFQRVNFKSYLATKQQTQHKIQKTTSKIIHDFESSQQSNQPKYVNTISPTKKLITQTNIITPKRNQRIVQQEQKTRMSQKKPTSLWSDITNVDNSFNSSRLESKQCLQNLSRRVLKQLQFIDNTIQDFNHKMKVTLDSEYKKLKEYIKQSIQKVFQYYQEDIKREVGVQEKKVNQDIYDTKKQLYEMYVKIEKMKQGIQSTHWKKVAGQLLSSQIESEVQLILKRSEKKSKMTSIALQLDNHKLDVFASALSDLINMKMPQVNSAPQKRFF